MAKPAAKREPGKPDRYSDISAEVEDLWQEPLPPSIPTGIVPLDRALDGGFMAESLSVLVAGTGRGKTGLMIQIVRGWLAQGYSVLFIETEMSKRQIAARFLAQVKRHAWREVYQMGPSERHALADLARQKLGGLCVWRWQPGQELAELIGGFIALYGQRGLVVLDQISDLARAQRLTDMRYATGTVTAELKALAEQHKTVILAVSQTARTVTADRDRSKRGRDFEGVAKDAGEVEADAANLFYLVTEPCPRDGTSPAQLHIAKCRGGPSNEVVGLRFYGALGSFEPDASAELTAEQQTLLRAIQEHTSKTEYVGIKVLKDALSIGQGKLSKLLYGLTLAHHIERDPRLGIRPIKPAEGR